ncbi:MAG TPA: hypothetical protein VGQ21_19690 [Thermoanaerobaculia bacterium]|jgi:hypothetical protein|nr:hypothetical protein [Thermoanaerobaculia bacterium]
MDEMSSKTRDRQNDDLLDRRVRMRFILALAPLFLAFVFWAFREAKASSIHRGVLLGYDRVTTFERFLADDGTVPAVFTVGATLSFAIFAMTYLQTGFRTAIGARFSESNDAQSTKAAATTDLPVMHGGEHLVRVIMPAGPVTIHDSIDRLQKELDALSYRGNLSLVLGSATTVSGILMFGYFVFFKQPPIDPAHGNPWWYIAEFLPRVSLIIIIEVFAFFFLRLYKAGLGDVKYFQNELTNVEARAIALQSAKDSGDKTTEAIVIIKFAETERNFVLRKGEVTPDIKREEMERGSTASILKEISSIVRAGIPHARADDTKTDT